MKKNVKRSGLFVSGRKKKSEPEEQKPTERPFPSGREQMRMMLDRIYGKGRW